MRTNIDINDKLLNEAFKYTQIKTKKGVVELALQEFVQNHKRKDIRDLIGKVKIDSSYDYKSARN